MLVILVAIAAFAVWYSKRRGVVLRPGPRKRLRVVERVALSRHSSLVVVEYEGKPLLIGEGASGLSMLSAGEPRKDPDAGD